MTWIFIFAFIFLVSYFGVAAFLRWSLRKQLLDIPNERSSHTAPTPRGAGVVIVCVGLASYIGYCYLSGEAVLWAYVAGAMMIAVVSWLDDVYGVSFVWRFLVHSIAALLVIYQAGAWQSLYFPILETKIEMGLAGPIVSFLWIVWLTNAYNFMDGIDGISGIQAVTAGAGWLLIGYLLGFSVVSFFGGVLAFSGLAFLFFNWPPARVFLGDVGSAFLGFTFAAIPFVAGSEYTGKSAPLPLIALFLVWFFVFDTVITFLSRLVRGQKVWTPHREHLYQRLVISGYSHRTVSIVYGVFSATIVLCAVAAVALRGNLNILLVFVIIVETLALLLCTNRRKVLT
jgi:UDP-N-acetylmuramyl pentapeptide phosphotransferase/UDP-N-acetylglucosamine-1-phosphate transferase